MTIKAILAGNKATTENTNLARELFNSANLGTILPDQRVELSLLEAVYLSEKKKLTVFQRAT